MVQTRSGRELGLDELPVKKRRLEAEIDRTTGSTYPPADWTPVYDYVDQFCTTAKVLVGPKQTSFTVSIALLSRVSPVFKAALGTDWTNNGSKPLELKEDDPFIVAVFLDWAHSGRFMVMQPNKGNELDRPTLSSLCKLYIFADCRQIRALQNDVIATIYHERDQLHELPLEILARIFAELPENAKLRQLVVDSWAYYAGEDKITDDLCAWVPSLVADIARIMLRDVNRWGYSFASGSFYIVDIGDDFLHSWRHSKI